MVIVANENCLKFVTQRLINLCVATNNKNVEQYTVNWQKAPKYNKNVKKNMQTKSIDWLAYWHKDDMSTKVALLCLQTNY